MCDDNSRCPCSIPHVSGTSQVEVPARIRWRDFCSKRFTFKVGPMCLAPRKIREIPCRRRVGPTPQASASFLSIVLGLLRRRPFAVYALASSTHSPRFSPPQPRLRRLARAWNALHPSDRVDLDSDALAEALAQIEATKDLPASMAEMLDK